MKKLSEENKQKIVSPNPIVVTTFLDRHRLVIVFKVCLLGTIAIFKLPQKMSHARLWVGI